jgi:predicted exporter
MVNLLHLVGMLLAGVGIGYAFRGLINREGKAVEAKIASTVGTELKKL